MTTRASSRRSIPNIVSRLFSVVRRATNGNSDVSRGFPGRVRPPPSSDQQMYLTVKLVHAAHPAAARHRRFLLLFRNLADERFSGEEQRRNGRRVLKR